MRTVEVHARKQGVGTAIEKFQSNIPPHVSQHGVITHSESILVIVAVGIPRVDGCHRAGIRGDERWKRKDAMAVLTLACRKGRDHGMTKPWKHALALTAVVQSVFFEGFGQPVTRRGADCGNAESGPDSLAKSFSALLPLWRRVVSLANASHKGRTRDGIRAESVE